MKTAKIYFGVTVEAKCEPQLHPLTEVKRAKELIDSKQDIIAHSNSPDFIAMIKYYGEQEGYSCEFFLNGEPVGNEMDPIFEDLNKSMEFMDECMK